MAIDPNQSTAATATATATATAAATTATNTTITTRPIRPAPPPAAAPHSLVYATTSQALPVRTQSPSPGAAAAHQQGVGVLYPVGSSGRGFIPRPIRPAVAGGEQTVTVANAGRGGGAYPSRPLSNYPPQQHLMRPPYNNNNNNNNNLASSPLPPPVRGLPPLSSTPEVAPPSSVPDINGFKDFRDKSRDDNLTVIRGRKVRMTDRASLYVHCRSWLRNGFPEEIQPQYGDAVRSLPKPSPISKASATVPKKGEGEVEEKEEKEQDDNKTKDEECVENLSPAELLKEHVKRARKVRARLREERLQRIERYKTRLALLLPPVGEQFRNDLAAGN